jgi:eukaryotic-like serine/threonine-protein kinase
LMPGSEAMIGAVLSRRYKLVRLLGEGGMGAVFEARDLQGDVRYAIKVLHPEYTRESQVLTRFYAEAEAVQRLSHPNVARCFGFHQAEDGSPYLVMELLDGAALIRYLGSNVAYDVPHAVPIVRSILSALAAAHGQGIVHRDLKPDNIMLVPVPPGPPVVKLLDFGVAKIMDSVGGMMTKTKTGMLLGTPGYMSPEQIRSAKDVDLRSDLWSVGVIFYELLTGRDPFAAPNEMSKLTLILTSEPVPVDQARPALAPWRAFFARALAKDPAERFGSADEMARAMDATASAAPAGPAPAITDMSPQLPAAAAMASNPAPQIRVVQTPVPAPPPGAPRLADDNTLKAGEMPMISPPRPAVPMWLAALVALFCLGAGIAVGFFIARS